MSRIAPDTKSKNPSSRFYEWEGGNTGGQFSYYDRSLTGPDGKTGANVTVKLPFAFIVLDETSTIRGWCDAHDCAIFSNEVRDTVAEPFVVKTYNGPLIAEGMYREIRDTVVAQGGRFTATVYIAYKDVDKLKIGAVQFHGAALNSWVEFRKVAGQSIYSKAVKVTGFKEGKKGSITYRTPVFALIDCSKEADDAAGLLQVELKKYHTEYFARTKTQAATPEASAPAASPAKDFRDAQSQHRSQDKPAYDEPPMQEPPPQPAEDDSVPF